MHREEGDVEADKKEPEANLTELLAEHPAGDLGKPVRQAPKRGKRRRR